MTNHHWRVEKIYTLASASEVAKQLRAEGRKIVTLNGSFDVLHAGHLDILEEAKQQGDVLFVGVNSDASVRDGKGESRPIISEDYRAALLAGLACTDYVVVLDAPYNEAQNIFLRAIQPDIHVNGAEYGEPATWVEWPILTELGVQGYVCARREGLATSDIIQKIKSLDV